MQAYVLKRLALVLPTMLMISILIFGMLHLVPGDAALLIGGEDARKEDLARIREQLGLDQPVHVQYWRWITAVGKGDLGRSLFTRQPVVTELANRFSNTLKLAIPAMVLATVAGVGLGIISAIQVRTVFDYGTMIIALLGISVPSFALGLVLMLVFGVWRDWLPVAGMGTWKHYILPTITLAAFSTAMIARMTRSSMLEVAYMDFIRTARAKGLGERTVIYRHALRNSLLPVITVIGLEFGTLLAGSVITETVFFWPGIGRQLVDGIFRRDFPIVQGAMLVIAGAFVLINFLVDLLYGVIDPRVRYD